MPFTATINSISPQDAGSGQLMFSVGVTFADTASGFMAPRVYSFPSTTTQAAAVAVITADGTAYKNNLTAASNLQQKVGTVITI